MDCKRCGQIIAMECYVVLVLGDDGEVDEVHHDCVDPETDHVLSGPETYEQ